jgi:hypothetical protein
MDSSFEKGRFYEKQGFLRVEKFIFQKTKC